MKVLTPTLTFGKIDRNLRKCRDAKLMSKAFGKPIPIKFKCEKDNDVSKIKDK